MFFFILFYDVTLLQIMYLYAVGAGRSGGIFRYSGKAVYLYSFEIIEIPVPSWVYLNCTPNSRLVCRYLTYLYTLSGWIIIYICVYLSNAAHSAHHKATGSSLHSGINVYFIYLFYTYTIQTILYMICYFNIQGVLQNSKRTQSTSVSFMIHTLDAMLRVFNF